MDFELITDSAQETIDFGVKVGKKLRGGEVFAISGELGTGKTHFIKGVCDGLGCPDERVVNSPTFVIVNEYQGRFDVYHIDAYRLETAAEFENLGFDDFCYGGSVVLIEWADRVKSSLEGLFCIEVKIFHIDRNRRKIQFCNALDYLDLA